MVVVVEPDPTLLTGLGFTAGVLIIGFEPSDVLVAELVVVEVPVVFAGVVVVIVVDFAGVVAVVVIVVVVVVLFGRGAFEVVLTATLVDFVAEDMTFFGFTFTGVDPAVAVVTPVFDVTAVVTDFAEVVPFADVVVTAFGTLFAGAFEAIAVVVVVVTVVVLIVVVVAVVEVVLLGAFIVTVVFVVVAGVLVTVAVFAGAATVPVAESEAFDVVLDTFGAGATIDAVFAAFVGVAFFTAIVDAALAATAAAAVVLVVLVVVVVVVVGDVVGTATSFAFFGVLCGGARVRVSAVSGRSSFSASLKGAGLS